MAVTITKKATKVKSKSKSKAAYSALVDSLGILKAKIDALKPTTDEYNKLKAKLKGYIPEDAEPTDKVAFSGDAYVGVFAAARKERKIEKMEALHELLGDEVFYEIVSVKLTDADKYLSDSEKADLIQTSYGTTRNFTVNSKE